MSSAPQNGGASRRLFTVVRREGFEVSWVGHNPFADGFCYGSEDGRYLLTDDNGLDMGGPAKGSVSGEAINSVVRSGTWLAISTRAEINFIGKPEGSGKMEAIVFPYGAHGVSVLPDGHFVAPLGRTGLAVMRPDIHEPVTLLEAKKDEFYFYRAVALHGTAGQNPLVCAGRLGGVGITEYVEGRQKQSLRTVTFDHLDVVDVCSIGTAEHPLAMAALDQDGAVILFRDALRDKKPLTMRCEAVTGRAYRLLSCKGDLYVLTSNGLYGLLSLAERYLNDVFAGGLLPLTFNDKMDAIDANMVRDRWLMVVLADEVRKYDVQLIHQEGRDLRGGEIREIQPTPEWNEQDMPQTARDLVMAGA